MGRNKYFLIKLTINDSGPSMLKLLAVSAVALTTAFGAAQALAGAQDFTLHNGSSATINQVFISPSNESTWGEDVLGRDTLAPGESTHIQFTGYGSQCSFDIKVVDSNGSQTVVNNKDLCSITDLTYQ